MKSTFVLLFAIATPVFAGSRTSANYSITTEASDSGGTAATSPSYSQSGSIGGIAGVSNATLPLETARHGYLGQLYEIVSLQLAASPTTLNETETRQLTANLFLDDATTLFVAHASVNWSLVSGPLQPTVTNGLVSAKAVYQDTAATVQGTYGSRSASIALTVLDNLPDNYGSYAGDGITDSWQFQYFGLNNPLAAPQADPDADGQNNLYEFISGVIPTDPASNFQMTMTLGTHLNERNFLFTPRLANRTYTFQYSTDLLIWKELSGAIHDFPLGTASDPNASEARKFYRIGITFP